MRVLIALVVAVGLFRLVGTAHATAQIPCSDPAGCPDLVIDNTNALPTGVDPMRVAVQTFAPDDCAVNEGDVVAGRRTLLEFPTTQANWGAGALSLGNPADHPDWFRYDPCHGHYHFVDSAVYRLWTTTGYKKWKQLKAAHPDIDSESLLAANPAIDSRLRVTHKQGFCMIDTTIYPEHGGDPNAWQNRNCDDQGLDIGWGDEYGSYTEGQWVDITGLPAGNYVLEMETNATRLVEESNYANNSATLTFKMPTVPRNDNFVLAQSIGLGNTKSGNTIAASAEAGEPQPDDCAYGGFVSDSNTVWYKFKPSAAVDVQAITSGFDAALEVYTGTAIGDLQTVGCDDGYYQDRVAWSAQAGVTYWIQVAGNNGGEGAFKLALTRQ